MLAAQLAGDEQLELPLVEPRIVERHGKRAQGVGRFSRRERARDRRIQPTAEIAANGNIGAQPQRDAGSEQIAQGGERVGGLVAGLGVVELVVPAAAQPPIAPDGEAAGLEGLHPAEHRARGARRPEGEHLVESHGIGRRLDLAACEQGLGFAREHQVAADDAVEQRAHAEPVPRQEH